MPSDRKPNRRPTPPVGVSITSALAGGVPLEAVRELQRERDHLLLMHEALSEVERTRSMRDRLRIFVQAIQRIGFGRVTITLRDADLNATEIVAAGLSAEEERLLRTAPLAGEVWRGRLAAIERFRVSQSYYLDGRDAWVIQEFGDGLPSTLPAGADPGWSPADTLLVLLRDANGAILATLVLDDPSDRARPTLTRVRTVELFAQQVAAMLQQASLIELAERRARRLQTLHEIGSLLARSLDEKTILYSLARQLEGVLHVAAVGVLVPDDGGTPIPQQYLRGGEELDPAGTPALMRALAGLAGSSQLPARDAGYVALPAVVGADVVAIMVVETTADEPIHSDDTELLLTIASQAGAAISNARLYAESQRQRRQTEAMSDVARAVGESHRIDRVLQLILRHATALLRTDGATIALLRGDTLEVTAGVGAGEVLVGTRLPLHGSMSGRALRTASSIIGDDVTTDPDAYGPNVSAARVRNALIVPLLSAQGPVGVLSVFNRFVPFTEDDADVLQRLADQVAVAVVNARLFEEVAHATREWAVAFDTIGSGMVLLDHRGCIQRSNAHARTLMAVAQEEDVVGKEFHLALFGETSPCDECVHLAAITEGTVKRGIHDDRVRARVFGLTAAPHPLGGAVVTFDDITEYRSLAERYRRVVETSRDAIVITDRARCIAFANPAAIALFGHGADLIGMPVSMTIPLELRDEVDRREALALAGEPQSYVSHILRADGERRIAAITSAPLVEAGEVTGIVASLRDVTDERRARDAVTQSEARYRNLFDSASDAIYTIDVHGAFTSVNKATCRMTGLPADALLGHTSRHLLERTEIAHVAHHFGLAVSGQSARYECYFHRVDGERRLVSVTNTPIRQGEHIVGVLGIARDVTDERSRAIALERSEARYARLVESASDAIFSMDEEGVITAANRALELSVGQGRDALVGVSFAGLMDPRDVAAAEQLLRETFAGERSRGSLRYHGPDGVVRQGSVITSPILEGGRIVGALGIMRDVTDEQRLAEQLLHQEKLAAVGQLVSGVAHELNNPLAGVMAFAQLLLASSVPLDAEPRSAVETIHREAQRAAKIVSSLLTFARQQPAERAVARLNDIVTDTLALRRYAMRTAQIEVVLALDPELPDTWADPFQLQQVVLNLLGNAEQALAMTESARRIYITTDRQGFSIVLTVADNGPGISPESRDRVFNPFYTTKSVGQGTGLGLSIADGIVRAHGGRMRVDATSGGGATFTMELPIVTVPTRQEVTSSATLPSPSQDRLESRHVLVVDDEPAIRSAVSRFLSSLGHRVETAASGEEARALLAAGAYDVVLLDLRMPMLGGEVLYRQLADRDPRHAARVVFVTGDTHSEGVRRFLADTGRPVLGKPFQLDDLVAVLASVTT